MFSHILWKLPTKSNKSSAHSKREVAVNSRILIFLEDFSNNKVWSIFSKVNIENLNNFFCCGDGGGQYQLVILQSSIVLVHTYTLSTVIYHSAAK